MGSPLLFQQKVVHGDPNCVYCQNGVLHTEHLPSHIDVVAERITEYFESFRRKPMYGFKLRIVNVDMNGYCGRDYHPEKTDNGLVVTPLQMNAYWMNPETGESTLLVDGGMCSNDFMAKDIDNHEVVWITVADDGRTLELIGHEVELVPILKP
jgi:hypothetical protein